MSRSVQRLVQIHIVERSDRTEWHAKQPVLGAHRLFLGPDRRPAGEAGIEAKGHTIVIVANGLIGGSATHLALIINLLGEIGQVQAGGHIAVKSGQTEIVRI